MSRVTVCGWYGHGNAGDESYKLTFPAVFPTCQFSFGENFRKAEACVVGGGDIAYRPIIERALKFRGRRHLLSVSLTSCDCPELLKEGFDLIGVRDTRSVDLLSRHGIKGFYLPDFAFAMRPDPARGRRLIEQMFREAGSDRYQKVVACVLNGYLVTGEGKLARDEATFLKFAYDMARIADGTAASFLFLPFGTQLPPDDRVPNAWVASKCKWYKKNVVCHQPLSPQDTLDVIAASDAAVTSRLHAAIFCTLSGVPFIDVTHHQKSLGYLETAGLQDLSIDYWNFDRSRAADMVGQHLADPVKLRGRLTAYADSCRWLLEEFGKTNQL